MYTHEIIISVGKTLDFASKQAVTVYKSLRNKKNILFFFCYLYEIIGVN